MNNSNIGISIQRRDPEHVDGKLVGRYHTIPRRNIDELKKQLDGSKTHAEIEAQLAELESNERVRYRETLLKVGKEFNLAIQIWYNDPSLIRKVYAEVVKFAQNLKKGGIFMRVPSGIDDLRVQEIVDKQSGEVTDYVVRWSQLSADFSPGTDWAVSEPF